MGLYPSLTTRDHVRHPDGTETWVEQVESPGLVRTRAVLAETWSEVRTDCFCCSCDEDPESGTRVGSDPSCRNHGFAGERPCEGHGMPGSPDEDGQMPESVQAHNARRASATEPVAREGL